MRARLPGLGTCSDAAAYTVAVDWGDGTTSPADVTAGRAPDTCDLTATHTFAQPPATQVFEITIVATPVAGGDPLRAGSIPLTSS